MFRPLSVFNRDGRQSPSREVAFSADPFFRLQREMNRLFEDAFAIFGAPPTLASEGDVGCPPRLDVHEAGNGFEFEAELPGVDEKDIDVELRDNILTIRGEKRLERNEDCAGKYHVMERTYGSFSRSLSMPFAVDPDSIDATFRNGVLKIRLPKPPEGRAATKRIAIKGV